MFGSDIYLVSITFYNKQGRKIKKLAGATREDTESVSLRYDEKIVGVQMGTEGNSTINCCFAIVDFAQMHVSKPQLTIVDNK